MSEQSKSTMLSFKFTGWVNKVVTDNFGQQFVCRVQFDESESKYPQHITFKCTKKALEGGKIPELHENDKVEVDFFPWTNEGVSKNTGKEYIMPCNMTSTVKVIEPAAQMPEEGSHESSDDLPF